LFIIGEWCTTGEPDSHRFLLHDNGTDSDERIIVFSTDACLHHLSVVDTWYMKGNFALVPPQFQQLYVIGGKINKVFITIVYCLLERKTQSTYENLFNIIITEC